MSEADALKDWSDEVVYDEGLVAFSKYSKEKEKRKKGVLLGKGSRGIKVSMLCHCGCKYTTRKSDLIRGWGLSCSKSCAARRREFGRPMAKILGEV